MGVVVLTFIESTGYGEVAGFPVGFVRFTQELEVISSAVLNGGISTASAVFIMQVPKDYMTSDPMEDARVVRDVLGLPEDSVGMMTAAEVDHVFNLKEVTYGGSTAVAIATAGLSNHIVAGDVLDDYDEKHLVSERRAAALKPGTINICVVSPVPLTMEGKVNLFIPLVEAKSAAMADLGYVETGTTSDSMAVFCPSGADRVNWTGTGSDIGIASAKAVRSAVLHALNARNEHPIPTDPVKILMRLGYTIDDVYDMSDRTVFRDDFNRSLLSIFAREEISIAMDMAWVASKRTDSLVADGDSRQIRLITGMFSELLGVPPVTDGALMDNIIHMLAIKAGEIDG